MEKGTDAQNVRTLDRPHWHDPTDMQVSSQVERRVSHDALFPRFNFRLSRVVRARWEAAAREDGLPLGTFIKRCVERELELREALRVERERFEREGR